MKRNGFTLIEMLAVVVLISVLTAIAVPQYRKSIRRAEAANALINLRSVYDAAKRTYATSGSWPDGLDQVDVSFLEANEDGTVGEFTYSFFDRGMQACYAIDNGYCLRVVYRDAAGNRDVYSCVYAEGFSQYQNLCESLGSPCNIDRECVIQ